MLSTVCTSFSDFSTIFALRTCICSPTGPGAGCYSVRCTSQNSLVIDIGANQSGASQTVPCGPGSGGVYVYGISGYNGAIVCPSPEDLCGTAERFGVAAGYVLAHLATLCEAHLAF
jgi:hypothetical protein